MAQLDKTFPTNDCSMCVISPKLVEAGCNLNINILTATDVEAISGEPVTSPFAFANAPVSWTSRSVRLAAIAQPLARSPAPMNSMPCLTAGSYL